MEKIKSIKWLLMATLLTITSFSMTACSDDDDDNESAVGTWSQDWTETDADPDSDHSCCYYIVLNEGGTGYWVTVPTTSTSKIELEVSPLTWSQSGNKVTIKLDGEEGVFTISGNTLSETFEEDGKTYTDEYTRTDYSKVKAFIDALTDAK